MVREYSSEITSSAQIPMDRLLDEVYGLEVKLASMFVLHELTQAQANSF